MIWKLFTEETLKSAFVSAPQKQWQTNTHTHTHTECPHEVTKMWTHKWSTGLCQNIHHLTLTAHLDWCYESGRDIKICKESIELCFPHTDSSREMKWTKQDCGWPSTENQSTSFQRPVLATTTMNKLLQCTGGLWVHRARRQEEGRLTLDPWPWCLLLKQLKSMDSSSEILNF